MATETKDEAQQPLPRVYAPFLPVLEQLSLPLQQLLRGQLLQLEGLARTVDRPRVAEYGELEGIGGLATRGDIAQLVQSELLLRTEAPLEFLRRLAEHEAVYHEKVYANPGSTEVYRAVVSVGPGLLGHGRLVALASLFFLARIARQREARFHWCFLPRADGAVWFDELSVNGIKRFLKAASYCEMSPEDLVESRNVWEGLQPAGAIGPKARILDWAIGASGRLGQSAREAAVALAPDSLIVDLGPPSAGEPRSARLRLRQHGRDRGHADIAFPDDRICLSALSDPFRPARPVQLPLVASSTKPPREGWEPLHFVSMGGAKLVRIRAGLLVLFEAVKDGPSESWLVELPDHSVIAGVGLTNRLLSVVLQIGGGSGEGFVFRLFHLGASRAPLAAHSMQVSSAHLFRNQPAHALPPLRREQNRIDLSSSSGQMFRLEIGPDEELRFQMLYGEAPTLLAVPPFRITWLEDKDGPRFRVEKGGRIIDNYRQSRPRQRKERVGLVYAPEERSLAYSVEPGRWEVPFTRQHGNYADEDGARTLFLELGRNEVLLSVRPGVGRISARIWSDARYGGDGTVRYVRIENGEEAARQPPLAFGEDALAIVDVKFIQDGYWGLAIGSDGEPSKLLHYRFRKKSSRYETTRYDLDRLASKAAVIPAEAFL
ncbi:MAG TPA: hypothetical protein VIT45_06025 [Allosphingosinicella sp.]